MLSAPFRALSRSRPVGPRRGRRSRGRHKAIPLSLAHLLPLPAHLHRLPQAPLRGPVQVRGGRRPTGTRPREACSAAPGPAGLPLAAQQRQRQWERRSGGRCRLLEQAIRSLPPLGAHPAKRGRQGKEGKEGRGMSISLPPPSSLPSLVQRTSSLASPSRLPHRPLPAPAKATGLVLKGYASSTWF